ncbi:sensor histidine kinase [Brachybacterium sp. YJGR34]|uniref:sensor histidine kinase n=1 Tax=Brachybacterium sp. YJGR34 TaxID=2059911 RepID=UPI000E0C3286|nr:sensor histidine kinase [Brachybacterium sp. YJGR34]
MTAAPPRRAPWVRDAALALAVAAVLGAVITIARAAEQLPPQPLALAFAAGFGAILLLRRHRPVTVLVLSVLGTFAYYTLQLPTIGVALPVVAALYSAAEQGRLRWAIGAGGVVFAVAMYFRVRDDPQPMGQLLGTDAVMNLGLIAAAIALGEAVRSHQVRTAQQEQITRLLQEQSRRETELRLREERERISRELHDTVGHALSVISLHAGVAADAAGHDEEAATAALEQVRGQAADSLQELRSMVRLLRTEDADDQDSEDGRHVRSLLEVPDVLAPARAAGLEVHEHLAADPAALSPAVDTAAYRVVQEAVTNVLRHAQATRLEVTTEVREDHLHLTVADDGRGPAEISTGGLGLVGMAERVRLLGGTLRTSGRPGGGFTVEARLPAQLGRGGRG